MPSTKRPWSHVDEFADLEDQAPGDYDPEDDIGYSSAGSGSGSDSDPEVGSRNDANLGREHYVPTSKSALRQRETQALGPQYAGSRISRRGAGVEEESDEHDPFDGEYDSEDDLDGEDLARGSDWESEEDGEEAMDDGNTDETSMSEDGMNVDDGKEMADMSEEDSQEDEDEDEDMLEQPSRTSKNDPSSDRSELRKLMSREQEVVSANLSAAHAADVRKGMAIKQQRKTYDALLNTRIQLQSGLIALNSLNAVAKPTTTDEDNLDTNGEKLSNNTEPTKQSGKDKEAYEAAYDAAINLWNNLEDMRRTFYVDRLPKTSSEPLQPVTTSTSLEEIWRRTNANSPITTPHVSNVIRKWSNKTAALSTSAHNKLTSSSSGRSLLGTSNADSAAKQMTVYDILQTQHLSESNIERLIARTRVPRSCAPIQAARGVMSDENIYDDADFYGQLLKELLKSRNVDLGGTAGGVNGTESADAAYRSVRRAAKVKRNVDVKASKGRKLKYTVHEKLQNFMAPEDRGAWGERQRDELFGSLLGQKLRLNNAQPANGSAEDVDGDSDDQRMDEEEALMLFRN